MAGLLSRAAIASSILRTCQAGFIGELFMGVVYFLGLIILGDRKILKAAKPVIAP